MRRDTGTAQSLGPLQRLSPSARQSATLSPPQPCFGITHRQARVPDLGREPGLPLVALRGIGAQQGSVSRNPGLWPEKRKVSPARQLRS